MKKFLLSAIALLGLASVAYAGDGSKDNPYTVDDIIALGTDVNLTGKYVQGYIVGSVGANEGKLWPADCVFGTTSASNTNLMLAGSSSEDQTQYCIPVALPSGAIRNALSLQQHPENLGYQVKLYGTVVKYFGVAGFRDVSAYEWIGGTPEGGTSSGGTTGGSTTLLMSGMSDFTIDNVSLSEGLSYVWSWADQYGAKASAFLKDVNYAAESYLISPELTLDADTKTATFSQALNFLNGNNRADFVNVCVREGNSGDWTVANVSTWPEGTDWGFSDGCEIDLSAYAGKTIQIAFHYKSTSDCAPTWEVKRLSFNGTSNGGPQTPENPGGGNDQPSGPSVEVKGLEQPFTTGLGFPEGTQAQVPTEVTTVTASDTGIEYNLLGCNVGSGNYLMVSGKNVEGAYISWTLDFPMSRLALVTTSGCSENAQSQVNVYAGETLLQGALAVNTHDATYVVEIPEECQAPGTVYKVESNTTKYNQQFAKFIYVNANEDGVDAIVADDSEAVYYNLQGQKVANPDKGIFIKVVGNKAVKVLK